MDDWNDPLSRDSGHFGFLTECLDENADEAAAGLIEVVDTIAREGPTQEELTLNPVAFERDLADPQQAGSFLFQAVIEELLGGRGEDVAGWLNEMRAVTSEHAAAALARAVETAILLVPEKAADPPPRFRPLPEGSLVHLDGRRAPVKKVWQRPFTRKEYLAIADEGFTWVSENARYSVSFADCQAVLEWTGGEVALIGGDGSSLWFDPGELKEGAAIRALMESKIPPDRFIRLNRPAESEAP